MARVIRALSTESWARLKSTSGSAPSLNARSVRSSSRRAAISAMRAVSIARRFSSSVRRLVISWRERSADTRANADCSRLSSLSSSGLSTVASSSSFCTIAPGSMANFTMPAAEVYSDGERAATTRPCEDTSRTSVPRLTSVMRTRSRGSVRSAVSDGATIQAAASTSAATPPPISQVLRETAARACRGRSVAEVSRIMVLALSGGLLRPMHIACQIPCQ